MNSTVLKKYSEKLPKEVTDLVLGLSDPENIGLLTALTEHEKMSFDEMKEEFKLDSDNLTRRLNTLQNANLIRNFYEKSEGSSTSLYSVTDIFKQVVDSVYSALYTTTTDRIVLKI